MTDRHSMQCKWWNAIDVFVSKKEYAGTLSLSYQRSLAWNLDPDKDFKPGKDLLESLISLVWPMIEYTVRHFWTWSAEKSAPEQSLVGLPLHISIGRSIKDSTSVLQGRTTVSRLHCLIYSFCSTFVCHQMVLRRNMFPVPPSVSCILIITLEISYYLAGDTDYNLLVSILSCLVAF